MQKCSLFSKLTISTSDAVGTSVGTFVGLSVCLDSVKAAGDPMILAVRASQFKFFMPAKRYKQLVLEAICKYQLIQSGL